MFSRCWVVLASILALFILADSVESQCADGTNTFHDLHPAEPTPLFCQLIQLELINSIHYRMNFTQMTVEQICESQNCIDYLGLVGVPCSTLVSTCS